MIQIVGIWSCERRMSGGKSHIVVRVTVLTEQLGDTGIDVRDRLERSARLGLQRRGHRVSDGEERTKLLGGQGTM